ncbi:MFS transporter [Porcincola intestinalis]|uniref:MFS transporter n=1 Tax=Porcincola intestinalis TaxID=2606632 RepID=UPI002A91BC4F|nr:MFS transporter [Porcincola intestinalis]MDY5580121.1 MFS transporter [Porcincola intestinalis]
MTMKHRARASRDLTFPYALLQMFYWMNMAVTAGYASFFLLGAKLTNSQIGLLLASGGLLSALIQPLLAAFADRSYSLSVRFLMMLMSALLLVCSLLLVFLFHGNIAAVSVIYLLAYLILLLQQPFLNAIGAESIDAGRRLNFGLSRAFGSAGYMAAAFLLGQFSVHTGPVLVPAGIAAASFALLLSSAAYPQSPKRSQKVARPSEDHVGSAPSENSPAATQLRAEGSIFSFFARYPQYAVALVGLLPIFIGHIYINNYLLQIVESKGAGSSSMGNLMSVAALLELTVMLVYGKLRTWRPDPFWFRISGIFFTLKVLLTLLAPTIGFLYPVQLIQPLGWGLLSVSSVYYINETMAPSDKVKGQAFFTAVFTLGNVLGNLTAGLLLDHGGVFAMLLCGSIVSAIGAALLLLSGKLQANGEKT